ncbi:hypothetical protein ABQE57_17020 [Mycolicibacterium elephantis]
MSNQGSQDNAGAKKPRFNPESPGPLAELEAQWLRENKGLDVTAAQVRGILMYHGEFQKSPEREAQRRAEQEARAKRDAENKQRAAERKQKKLDQLAKAKERVAELERVVNGLAEAGQQPDRVIAQPKRTRRATAQAEEASA